MKKSKCRLNLTERDQHERAVKIRKMTDAQLCEFIDGLYDSGMTAALDQDAKKRHVVLCADCGFGGISNSFKCQSKESPCRGRLVLAADYCPYGKERAAAGNGI